MVAFINPFSDDNSSCHVELLSELVRNGIVSLVNWSDGSSSSVEEEPLLGVHWLMVLNSDSELVSTNVFMPEKSSVLTES